MPTISVFFGIVIRMYYDDHGPPHFHVYYGEYAAVINIDTLELRDGRLPRRAMSMVTVWAQAHRAELKANWARAEMHQALQRIEPLE
jgi:hypothetical protein